jgi:hypothetical protein
LVTSSAWALRKLGDGAPRNDKVLHG